MTVLQLSGWLSNYEDNGFTHNQMAWSDHAFISRLPGESPSASYG